MKTLLYPANSRGSSDFGWLSSHHSFSFGDYHDPLRMGFGALRVLNDDTVAHGKGFPLHGHQNMEIISIVLSGILRHEDSTGSRSDLIPGEVQVMSAGTGIRHSEFNGSVSGPVSFLQIWIIPEKPGTRPRYVQKKFPLPQEEPGQIRLLASPDGRDDSLTIGQQAFLSRGLSLPGSHQRYPVHIPGNGVFLFVLSGRISVNGKEAGQRGELEVTGGDSIPVETGEQSEVLWLEVPMIH